MGRITGALEYARAATKPSFQTVNNGRKNKPQKQQKSQNIGSKHEYPQHLVHPKVNT